MALMKCIAENPFRILGLPVTATDREIKKQLNKLTAYYEMGKSVAHDTDFPVFSDVVRSPEIITEAAARIELPEQKLFYANFWFWPDNSVDEFVLEVLKEGNVDKAAGLWKKAALAQSLSPKNYSNFKNLALLNLIQATQHQAISLAQLESAVSRYGALFGYDAYTGFCSAVTLGAYKGDVLTSQKSFVDELSAHLGLSKTNVDQRLAYVFVSGFSASASPVGAYVKSRFIEAPTHRIEKAVASAESRRSEDPEDAYDACIELVEKVEKDIEFLKNVLSSNNLHLQSVSDSVANELLRSSTAFYNALYEDDETTVTIDRSTELTTLARRFAQGGTVKAKVAEDIKELENILHAHSAGRYSDQFALEITKLPSPDAPTIKEIRSIPTTLSIAITKCSKILEEMSAEVGEKDPSYVQASDMFAAYGLALLILYANKTSDYGVAVSLMRQLDRVRMSATVRARFDQNNAILKSNVAMASQGSSGGCYIATMAFGSYDAPEVMELRRFRDESLAKSMLGRLFIRVYYMLSPYLVRLLEDDVRINEHIRKLLIRFIGVIK